MKGIASAALVLFLAGCSGAGTKGTAGGQVIAPSMDGTSAMTPGTTPTASPGASAPAATTTLPPSGATSGGNGTGGASALPGSAAPMMGTAGTSGPASSMGGSMPMMATATMDPPGTVTLTMDSFMLAAGQETYKCQNFDNPFGGKDTAVNRIVTDMAPGSHHLHVYHMTTSATRTLEDCTISDFHPLMHAAGSPHVETQYPAGMAVKLLGTAGIRIQVHYLNTTSQPLMVNAVLKLTPTDSSAITKWISELYFSRATLSVPPGMSSITTTCTIPSTYGTIGLVYGGSHMHMRGVGFTVKTSTGMSLGQTTQWDEPPPFVYDPPVMLKPGDSISWTCNYNNTGTTTYTFGESASSNEMCIYLGRFFSAPDGAQLECQAMGATGTPFSRTY